MKSAKLFASTAQATKAVSVLMALAGGLAFGTANAVPTRAPIVGEIEHIHLNDPNDHWSGGVITVAGKSFILPRNLLLDLPANRLTLKQLFDQAPAACIAAGETGLAKSDTCNHTGLGGTATISANKSTAGNVIAGDVLIAKGDELVTGRVTYINYDEGYMRLNGVMNDAATGVMVRMNDPEKRHTIQSGLGCGVDSGAVNCSPDPRFALDTDNYTNATPTGFPICIPSTVPRTWAGLQAAGTGANASPAVAGGTAKANADGTGDALCPTTNRPANFVVDDSRRFAPILLNDNVEVEGNWEEVGGVKFLSYHTSTLMVALATKTALTQPDYFMPEEVFIETSGFQNFRIRSLFIGFSTLTPDILAHTLHYEPKNNTRIEKPLMTTAGCDAVAGAGTCSLAGLLGAPNLGAAGGNIFRVRFDVDFAIGADAGLDPCAQARAEPRFGVTVCPNWGPTGNKLAYNAQAISEMFAMLSPTPHEVQFRSGHLYAAKAAGITPVTVDITGAEATNGQYLYPLGMNLGGIETAEWSEINLNAFQTAIPFSGIPWNLDRRLSPNGCELDGNNNPVCETTPQPLDPFPFEAMDPRTQTNGCAALAGAQCELPNIPYNDPAYTASGLTTVRDRVISYVTDIPATPTRAARKDFNGNSSLLNWAALAEPALITLPPTPALTFCASNLATGCVDPNANTVYSAPTAMASGPTVAVKAGSTVNLSAAGSSDTNTPALALNYAWTQTSGPTVVISGAATASPSFTAPIGATDSTVTFELLVSNGHVNAAASVSVNVLQVSAPTAAAAATPTTVGAGSSVALSANGSADTNAPLVLGLTYSWTRVSGPTFNITNATSANASFTAPAVAAQSTAVVRLTVNNGYKTATQDVTVTINPVNPTVTVANKTTSGRSFTTVTASGSGVGNLSYRWTQVSGTTVSLAGTTGSTISFTAPGTPGNLVFRVTVTDSVGLTGTADVTVTVNADALRGAAIYTASTKKVTVWMNSNAVAFVSLTATFPDGGNTWTQTKTEVLNLGTALIPAANCNPGLSSPNVTKCGIALNVGTSVVPTAGTGTAAAPVGTWVTITSPGGGSILVPMQIK
jgi:hypothetical protein